MEVYLLFAQRFEHDGRPYPPQVLSAIDVGSLEGTSLDVIEDEVTADWNCRFEEELGPFDQTYSNTLWVKVTLNQPALYFRERLALFQEVDGVIEELAKPKGDHASYGGITVTRGRQGGAIKDDEIVP